MYLGDFRLGDTLDTKFCTVSTAGVPTTLAGTPVISAYVGNNVTQLTAGITLTVDFDAVTGLHNVRVVASGANGYATASNYQLVITTGTVGGGSVVGYVIGEFSIEARSALMPTTAARTLDVSATGEGGVDWANVGGPTTSVSLTNTTVATVTTATTATNVTTVNGLAANVITAAATAADFGTEVAAAVWDRDATLSQTQGTFGQAIGDPVADVDTIWGLANTNLDAAVSSRMATYTQPSGFLAATFPAGTVANTTNITAGTVTTATNVTTLNGIAANVITAASIAADAITDAKVAADVTIASVTGAVGSVTGAVGSVTGAVGSVTANVNAVLTNGAHGGAAATASFGGAGGITSTLTGNVTGSVGSVTGAVGSVTGNVGGNVVGSVGSVTGSVGSVTGAVGSVTGLTAATVHSDLDDIQTRLPAALVGGRMDSNLGAISTSATAADNLERSTLGIVTGTVGAGSSTTSIVTSALSPAAAVIDQYKGRIVTFDSATTTANLRGQSTDITANTALGVLTVTALTTAPVSGDTFVIT